MHHKAPNETRPADFSSQPLVIIVSPIPLFPVTGGGAARILGYVRHLRAQGFRVGLVTVHHGARDLALAKAEIDELWIATPGNAPKGVPFSNRMREYGRRLPPPIQFLLRRGLGHLRQRWTQHKGKGSAATPPSALAWARNPVLDGVAREVIAREKPCAVIAVFVWTARCLNHAPEATCKIIDAIDIQHRREVQANEAGFDLPGSFCTAEEEATELHRADVVLAIQEEELAALQAFLPNRRVVLCEHAYPVVATPPSPPPDSASLFFVGNYYEPNNDGINLFLGHAWPRIRAARPDATLHICGKVCAAIAKAPPGVVLHGPVPSLAPFYKEAAIVLNPVPYGTGLKIKTVEALCEGKALVTTPAGVAGLPQEGALPYVVSAIEDMAAPILEWLENPESRKAMEQRAVTFAQDRFAPHVAYRGLENLLWETVGMGTAAQLQTTVYEGNNS